MPVRIVGTNEERPRPRRNSKGARVLNSGEYLEATELMIKGLNPYQQGIELALDAAFFKAYGKSGGRMLRAGLFLFREEHKLAFDIEGPFKKAPDSDVQLIYINAMPAFGKGPRPEMVMHEARPAKKGRPRAH